MSTRLAVTSVKVLDQDEALDFYVNKLGLEKGTDIRQGPFRWLTVRFPGSSEVEIFLEQPGPPVHDEATAAQLRELVTKGAMSSLVFHTDDARAYYDTLRQRGVTDFTQEPIDHAYGTDMGIRDPFGNGIRILQPKRRGGRRRSPEPRDPESEAAASPSARRPPWCRARVVQPSGGGT